MNWKWPSENGYREVWTALISLLPTLHSLTSLDLQRWGKSDLALTSLWRTDGWNAARAQSRLRILLQQWRYYDHACFYKPISLHSILHEWHRDPGDPNYNSLGVRKLQRIAFHSVMQDGPRWTRWRSCLPEEGFFGLGFRRGWDMPETHKQRLEFERKTSLLEVEALFPTFRVLTITQRTPQINLLKVV